MRLGHVMVWTYQMFITFNPCPSCWIVRWETVGNQLGTVVRLSSLFSTPSQIRNDCFGSKLEFWKRDRQIISDVIWRFFQDSKPMTSEVKNKKNIYIYFIFIFTVWVDQPLWWWYKYIFISYFYTTVKIDNFDERF